MSEAQLEGSESQLERSEGQLRGDERTNGWTENLPILQDFVPYRGRCPASPHKNQGKVEQGKGTADHFIIRLLVTIQRLYTILDKQLCVLEERG